MIERFTDAQGRVRDRQVKPDAQRELQVAQVVSLSPVVVEVLASGRRAQLFKRLRSLDVGSVGVGDLILVASVTQGLIGIGEVI